MESIIKTFEDIITNQDKLITLCISIALFLILVIFKNKLSKGFLNVISKIFLKNKEKYKNPLKESLQKPLATFLLITGIFLLIYLNIALSPLLRLYKICTILVISWAVVNYLSNNLFLLFHFGENADDKMNTTAIKFISNILKILVISFAIVMVISELGYNINGLLTGIGVGGLAISLAAQEAVSNLISGFIIVFEKPFIVGEMILTSNMQGTVEEVQMRSTKIRTLEDSVVTVPNSKLTSDAIINLSRMQKRLISLEFGLTYDTSNELMKKCQSDIEQYLTDDEDVLPNPVRVNFTKLDDSSLNISITCYSATAVMDDYLKVVSKVNYKIKEIIENNNVSFAFPSTSVYIEKK